MKVTVEESGPCRKLLRIEVPAETIDEAYLEILGVYQKSANIPGFRKGRAPQNLVAARYAKQILQDVKDQVVPKAYRDAVKEKAIEVVSIIDVKDQEAKAGKPLELEVTLDVRPDFEVPTYEGIPLERNKVEVSDQDVEAAEKSILEQFATFEEVTGRAVVEGDLVQVDYFGTMDGEGVDSLDPAAEGLSRGADFWVRVDENSFLPGFGEALVGAEVDEKRSFPITFDAEFTLEALAGKTADYTATVKAIRGKKLPEVDEDLLKKLKVESADDLREQIRKDLERAGADREDGRLKQEIIRFLMEGVTLELPKSVVDQETRNLIYDMVNQNTARGVTREEIEGNREQIFEAAGKNAEDRVKLNFILDRIAGEKDIDVLPREVDERIQVMASRYAVPPEKIRADLEEKEALDDIEAEIRQSKTLSFLLEKAEIKG